MMCPGLWTLDFGLGLPLDSRAFTLRFLVFLTHSLYPQLSSFCLWIAPFTSPPCTHARTNPPCTLHQHLHITSMISIHRERHPSILYELFSTPYCLSMSISFHVFFFTFYAQVLSISFHAHSCFMSITVLICHLSLVSFVCLYSVVSVSLSCTSYLHCDPQAISYSCTI